MAGLGQCVIVKIIAAVKSVTVSEGDVLQGLAKSCSRLHSANTTTVNTLGFWGIAASSNILMDRIICYANHNSDIIFLGDICFWSSD